MKKLILLLLLATILVACNNTPVGKAIVIHREYTENATGIKISMEAKMLITGEKVFVPKVNEYIFFKTKIGDTVVLEREPYMLTLVMAK
ncbi:hypothetical protein K8Q94_02895 [Candidatus Nomurabacteria bacterium]|nr:hypothetical protein [Candidatus Nomurabacteria bacterium]